MTDEERRQAFAAHPLEYYKAKLAEHIEKMAAHEAGIERAYREGRMSQFQYDRFQTLWAEMKQEADEL